MADLREVVLRWVPRALVMVAAFALLGAVYCFWQAMTLPPVSGELPPRLPVSEELSGGPPARVTTRPAEGSPSLELSRAPGRVSILPDENSKLFFVTVGITGPAHSRAFKCIVDSGSTLPSITREQAGLLGFDVRRLDFSTVVGTANGRVNYATVRLRSVMIAGRFALSDVPALVAGGDDEDCALGMSLLNGLRMTLENGSLELSSKR
jgi:clan AA aspartic protease (TIGR02281 family)